MAASECANNVGANRLGPGGEIIGRGSDTHRSRASKDWEISDKRQSDVDDDRRRPDRGQSECDHCRTARSRAAAGLPAAPHQNRERIPERTVHAKGWGAHGTFTVTHDIIKYTKAKIFSQIGKKPEMIARFSNVAGELGAADAGRDLRGFALKFYTEEGNWDLAGNNTPIFFVRDPYKFPDFIHTQKRHPRTNLRSPTAMWDFWSLSPKAYTRSRG